MENTSETDTRSEDYSAAVQGHARVDGNYLVITSGTVLPPYCIKTNEPVDVEDIQKQELTWCPPIVGLLILLSGLVLIFVYFLVRQNCLIGFGLSPDIARKYKARRKINKIAVFFLFFVLLFSGATDSMPVMLTTLGLFIGGVVWLFVGHRALAIAKYRQGEYWVTGCSKEFLARLNT